MKKTVSAIMLSSLVIGGLAGCGSSTSSVDNGESSVKLSGDTTVVRSNGVNPLMSPKPIVYLEQGKAKVEVQVKKSDKDTYFNSSIFEHLEGGGSASSLTTLSGNGNYSDKEEVDVPKSGYYDIDSGGGDGDGQITENSGKFNGNWEVTVTQKPQKDDKYDNRLHMALVDQSVGGEIKSKLTESFYDKSYTRGVTGFRVNGENDVSFLTETDEGMSKSTMTDAKWTSKEKDAGTEDYWSKFLDKHPDAESITDIKTSKGGASIVEDKGEYYVVFNDTSLDAKKFNVSSKVVEEFDNAHAYWDINADAIYFAESVDAAKGSNNSLDTSSLYLNKYDVKKNKFVVNDKNSRNLAKIPFGSMDDENYATGEDGNIYIINGYAGDSYQLEVVAYNKNFKQLTKPVKLDVPYADIDKTIAVAAYKNRLDIWSLYDARVLTNLDYNNPQNIGVNRYTLTLE